MGLIGSAVGAGTAIFGGIKASQSMKARQKMIEQEKADNQQWYDKRYNEDATQRADAQHILTQTEESIKNRNKQAAGAQAVMGGTDETTAAAKEANNQALSQATSNINAMGEQRKANIEGQYMQTKADLDNKLENNELMKAQAITQAAGGVADAASGLDFGKSGKKGADGKRGGIDL